MMRLESIQIAREIGISRQRNHNKIEWQKYAKSNKVHWDLFREDFNGSPDRPPPQTAPKRHTNSLGYRFAH